LYVFSEGDFFGERNLFGGQTAPYSVQALEPVKVCSFTRENFRALLAAHPDISLGIIEALEERIARMENAMQSLGVRSLDGRIAALLLDYAEKYGTEVPEGLLVRLPLSREGIANALGVARETVSRKLGQLETDGVIRSVSNRSIVIVDRGALRASAGLTP
jgi:CRP/FNR family transcriptional regulator